MSNEAQNGNFAKPMLAPVRVLNLYAGIGGNRKHWENVEVTAIEYNEEIAVEGIEKTFPKTYKSIKEKRDRIHSSRERNFLLQLGDFVYEKTLSLLQQTQNINQNDKTDNHKEGD